MGIFGLKDALGGTLRQLLASNQNVDFLNTDFVDLGNLNWNKDTNYKFYAPLTSAKAPADNNTKANILCAIFKTQSLNDWGNDNLCIGLSTGQGLWVRHNSYTDITAFKNAMKGILLAYEKASS